ncbi:DUF3918 family protein [Fictibacillus iocasae]|uniref:DUF3918 family protein n=1 Tax=Fictibacillus iocasae TaxID=2715437 RepID=A0ABW2NQP2_9BACL
MNRSFNSLLALGIGAAAFAMKKKKSSSGMGMMMMADEMWRSKSIKKMRKKIAKAIY